ncbi:unnamed protein product [Parnassius apollo]|uniref:(apollo) hypothetical protein n=1 Tax=Parnassius apollo TaxID=110799 RepID=A0A8S3XZ50_PARAO|nr:unnamed protein product [Parnassius apollo]
MIYLAKTGSMRSKDETIFLLKNLKLWRYRDVTRVTFIVYEYFEILEQIDEELDLKDKPHRIYNLDETSFCDNPVKGKIICKKGFHSTQTTSGPERSKTTVLLATNACRDKLPPLITFQGKHLWTQRLYTNENVKPAYAVSEKGWMETTIFENNMKEVLVPATKDERRPLLLIFDDHSTHVDLSVIEYAASEWVTIVKLPAHVLQPLDYSTIVATANLITNMDELVDIRSKKRTKNFHKDKKTLQNICKCSIE